MKAVCGLDVHKDSFFLVFCTVMVNYLSKFSEF